MKTLVAALAAAWLLLPSFAFGQVNINIRLPLPPVPPLVVVSPGIQVVENFQDEVFLHAGFYWTRRENRWYRAPSPQHTFAPVEAKVVPAELVKIPPGHYKHWKKAKHERKAEQKHDRHDKHHGKGKKR